jgi:hypothetical protein
MTSSFNHDEVLSHWAGVRLSIAIFGPFATIDVRDGVLQASRSTTISVHPISSSLLATASPRWASEGALRAMLFYPLVQLGCRRPTTVAAIQNTAAGTFLLRLGF